MVGHTNSEHKPILLEEGMDGRYMSAWGTLMRLSPPSPGVSVPCTSPNLEDISVCGCGPAPQPMLLCQQLCQAQLEGSSDPPYGFGILWPLTTALQVTYH